MMVNQLCQRQQYWTTVKTILKEFLDEDNGLQIKFEEGPFLLFHTESIDSRGLTHVK